MSVKLQSASNITNGRSDNHRTPIKPMKEVITNGFFTVDRKWTVTYWNNAAEKLLGVPAGDIVGKNLWEEFVEIIPLNFYNVYHKAFLQDIPMHFEEYWGEMGAWFDVVTYHCDDTLSVSFKTGSKKNYANNPEDVVKKLETLNELYRFVTEVTNDCLWEWDLQSSEQFWIDGGHKRVFGYPIENALIPQSFWESRLHPEDKSRVLAGIKKILKGKAGIYWEDEYRFRKADGEYAWVHDRGHILYDEEDNASRIIGATQDITEMVLLRNRIVRERHTKQQEILSAVLNAQEKERSEIGQEMHDNLNQVLAMAKLYVQLAKTNENKRNTYLEKSSDLIVKVIDEIRRISKVLVVPGIHILGLYGNIRNLIADLTKLHSLKIEFYAFGIDEENLGEKLQLTLFRIVQEQLNNILKHARATHATINMNTKNDKIILVISDNGEGCDMAAKKTGVGIINIKSRAELYHGSVTIVSKPGEGYELKVVFPLKEANT